MTLGGNFAREIPNQIHDCRLFLLVLNDNVYHSEHIENEVGIAFSRVNKKENILILPLELGDFTRKDWVEYYLIHTQSVKFPAQPDEKRIQRLVKQIAKALNRETQPAPKSTTPKAQAQPAPIPQATLEPLPVEIIKRGECGDNVNYTLDKNGVLTISGNGSMWNFYWESTTDTFCTPWEDERGTIVHIEIQDGVTSIGRYAFFECTELRGVNIPNSVTYIGRYAFSYCVKLKTVHIPDSVTYIGWYAFSRTDLTSVTIPDSVTIIGKGAFYACEKLKSVSFSVHAEVSENAFPEGVLTTYSW